MAGTSPLVDKDLLIAAISLFDTALLRGALTTAIISDHDAKRLADDALQVSVSFKDSIERLGRIDSEYPGSNWKGQWDPLDGRFGELLKRVKSVSIDGAQYIDDFNANVASKFSPGASNIKADKQLLANWLTNNPGDRGLKAESEKISQDFIDLSDKIIGLRNAFSKFATEKGAELKVELEEMYYKMKSLQQNIAWEQSEAAQAQGALDGVLAGLSKIGGFFESLFSSGHSHKLMDEARERIEKHIRFEEDLRRQKDRVAQQARQVAVDKSKLHDVQAAFSILAQDVIDVSGRLNRFANMWATAHSNIMELSNYLGENADIDSSLVFSLKVKVIDSTAAVFASEMREFSEALGDLSKSQDRIAYYLSPQFGGSDFTRGVLFNDARLDLDVEHPIVNVTIASGWVIDGTMVTYRLRNGQTQTIVHDVERTSSDTLTLRENGCIGAVNGKSGSADNGEPWMGDCVQQLTLVVQNSVTGAQRTFGPFGTAKGLSENATTRISWSGQLLAFAGRANDSAGEVGLRGIAFVQKK
ncbi:hypothetical protein CTheo_6938 [Ceratobasidium theobromae]|uniref:Jacalin-type lectin domain-containing protein n=1 Tax=Ceratobasidium theobromae TaxID=1582974 RepID=A0A5N5QDT6_9AGAM|nr:hypothetical protein CTheo_6938 [Ceratobasidium theobromae]